MWPELNSKPIEVNKKDIFKEPHYNYIEKLDGQIIIWKRVYEFFEFIERNDETKPLLVHDDLHVGVLNNTKENVYWIADDIKLVNSYK